jgi:hypothetical protein
VRLIFARACVFFEAVNPSTAGGDAPIYAIDECFQQGAGQPQSCYRAALPHYNFVRIHKTLRVRPAMAAGVTDRLWSIEELIGEALSNGDYQKAAG